jgi:hypothetical protein
MLQTTVRRRAVRRAVQTRCQVVGVDEFRLLGERVVDLSPRGMLVACDVPTRIGDDMLVSFKVPGRDELWLDAEAVVARIIEGQRWGDAGYCAGLDFTYFEKTSRHELLAQLAGYPPPVPRRRLRTARERMIVPYWSNAVLVRPIVMIQDEPVIPLVRKKSIPRGVFFA